MNCKKYIGLMGFMGILSLTSVVLAQSYTEKISRHKMVEILPTATLEIASKYGNIHVSTWDKDSVMIDIEFDIHEKNEARFNKIKSNVDFNFSGNAHYLLVETVFGTKYSSFFKDLQEATNFLSADNNQTKINYYLTIPDHINLKINNKYGNVFIPDFKGNTNIVLSNGDFQGKKLEGQNELEIAFGKANIGSIDQGTLNLNFVTLQVNNLGQVTITSKSSNLNIKKGHLIKLESKRDEITVDSLTYLFGNTYFSNLTIHHLTHSFNLQMQYGELVHLNLSKDFNLLKLKANGTNSDILLNAPSPYTAVIQQQKANVLVPKSVTSKVLNWQTIQDGTPVQLVFKDENAKQRLTLEIIDAELKITHQ